MRRTSLIDTGASKAVIYLSHDSDIISHDLRSTGCTTDLNGFGLHSDKKYPIYTTCLKLRSGNITIQFNNVNFVVSGSEYDNFPMILPYRLFHEFDMKFNRYKSASAEFGVLTLDTMSVATGSKQCVEEYLVEYTESDKAIVTSVLRTKSSEFFDIDSLV